MCNGQIRLLSGLFLAVLFASSCSDPQAKKLAQMFVDNFRTFAATAAPEVKSAGPKA